MLGLSTQVTAVWSYISGGPYKTYEWDKTKIDNSFIYLRSVGVLRDNMVPYAPALFLNG